MRTAILCLLVSTLGIAALADGQQDDSTATLDAKITQKLAHEQWDDASKAFVRVLWEDYRRAHLDPSNDGSRRSVAGKMPDVTNYDDYVGSYMRDGRLCLQIMKDEKGRFFMGPQMMFPAVCTNGLILWTTGDVVYSPIPQIAKKPYCELEMGMLLRVAGEFYLADIGALPKQWVKLTKADAAEAPKE